MLGLTILGLIYIFWRREVRREEDALEQYRYRTKLAKEDDTQELTMGNEGYLLMSGALDGGPSELEVDEVESRRIGRAELYGGETGSEGFRRDMS